MSSRQDTDALIRPGENVREAAIRNAIDAVYAARDDGGTMHDAGEAAAGGALAVVVEALRAEERKIIAASGICPGSRGYKRAATFIDTGTADLT